MTAPAAGNRDENENAKSAEHFIRHLSTRYFIVLAAIAALVVIDQAIVQPLLVRMNSYAPAINLAGRQRMLSQRIAKSALAMNALDDSARRQQYQTELLSTLNQWSAAHAALSGNHSISDLPKLNSSEFNHLWAELQPHYEAMLAAGNAIAKFAVSSNGPNSNTTARSGNDSNGNALTENANAVLAIVNHESSYLANMEKIVALVQRDADRQVALLRAIALSIAAALIVLLLGLGWYVVRPATQAIRGQVYQLESLVIDRTRQLSLANQSLRDEISQRQYAEVKNLEFAAQLFHAARLSTIGHFTAALAHEINQPLAAIANYAGACEAQLSESAARENSKFFDQIEQIKQAALRAGQIVRRIRNFVIPRQAIAPVEVDLNLLIAEVVELCRFEMQRNHVHVAIQLFPGNLKVAADAIQIQQVLVNLMQNASEAMQACPAHQRRLQLCSYLADGNAVVSVSDSGPGVAIDGGSLFKPFVTTKADGLGIGLSICRDLVEDHRGRIWVKGTGSSGATFCFSLPLIQAYNAGQSQCANCVCR